MHRHVMRTSSGALKRMHTLHTQHIFYYKKWIYLSHVAYAYLWFGALLRNYQSCLLPWCIETQVWLWTWRHDNRLYSTLSTALTWYIHKNKKKCEIFFLLNFFAFLLYFCPTPDTFSWLDEWFQFFLCD